MSKQDIDDFASAWWEANKDLICTDIEKYLAAENRQEDLTPAPEIFPGTSAALNKLTNRERS